MNVSIYQKICSPKYQRYPSMHIYIVFVSDLFKVLSGNQWKAMLGNNGVQMNVLIHLKNCS